MEISTIVGLAMAIGFAIMSWYNLQIERKRSIEREKQLIAAILSKDVKDYLEAVNDLETTTKDRLKLNKSEQDLAIEYASIDSVDKPKGIPIT